MAPAERAQVDGITREQMWWAPTAEDWAKPCLLRFQRTWEDALAVSRETGKPILLCINMDGEIASEHYAGVRYRSPEIAALYEPYVCVAASTYRHSPRDHDELGNRILCPRLGSVTCGEHIAIEPFLYERYMEGQRVSPRHIMIELDGSETYDVFYAFDTDSVFNAIEQGIAQRDAPEPSVVRGDRSLIERVASRELGDRELVEQAYKDGDADQRQRLMQAAVEAGESASPDLLRLAVNGLDADLAGLARQALMRADSTSAALVINDALQVPLAEEERAGLISALERIGENTPWANTLAAVHRGLGQGPARLDVAGWTSALEGAAYRAASEASADGDSEGAAPDRAHAATEALESATEPAPEARLELAEASLAMALDPGTALSLVRSSDSAQNYTQLLLQDARAAASAAEAGGAGGWRADTVLALSAYYLGELEQADARAERAVLGMPPGESSWSAMAVLALFADARQRAIDAAVASREEWPPEWLGDVNAAYAVLLQHPLGTDQQVKRYVDFLWRLGVGSQATRVLREGLERFPDSWDLHDRLRGRTLAERGVRGLGEVYDELLAAEDATPNSRWFAGYASLVAAEFQRRRGRNNRALLAYERAIGLYEEYIVLAPELRDSADHYVAVALAGRARLAMERRDYEVAVGELLASFERRPYAANALDGLNFSAVMTATTLKARLDEAGQDALAARVQAGLDALDPVLLLPPEFEGEGGPSPDARRFGRGRRNRDG